MVDWEKVINGIGESEESHILTDQEVLEILDKKIETICIAVGKSIQMDGISEGSRKSLFPITKEEYSYLDNGNPSDKKIGKVEAGRMQALGFKVMDKYGLDKNNGRIMWTENNFSSGISTERKDFSSKNKKGLIFEQIRKYNTTSGKEISTSWEVINRASLLRLS